MSASLPYDRLKPAQRIALLALLRGEDFKSAAKGVIAMRLQGPADAVLGMAITTAARDGLEVETSRGRTEIVRTTKFEVQNRGGKGRTVISRGTLKSVKQETVEVHLRANGG